MRDTCCEISPRSLTHITDKKSVFLVYGTLERSLIGILTRAVTLARKSSVLLFLRRVNVLNIGRVFLILSRFVRDNLTPTTSVLNRLGSRYLRVIIA